MLWCIISIDSSSC